MMIPHPILSRRTLLRGAGAAMALPFLEAMAPSAKAADRMARPRRLFVFYTPNGMMMDQFRPAATGMDYALTPTLGPLEKFKSRMSVITGLGHPQAAAMGDLSAGHGRSCPAFLTGTHVRQTEGTDIRCAISMDQAYARHIGDATALPSIEAGIDQPSLLGSCDIGYSCAYTNGLSWMNPTVPLPVAANPAEIFERMFGDGDAVDAAAQAARLRRQASLLDFVREDAARLNRQLGMEDRRKLDEYLTATRDIERRIQRAAKAPMAQAGIERPAGIPDSFDEHVRLMLDLQVLAMQADITRVATFMAGREISNRTYPEIGVPDSHHMLSHHGQMAEKKVKLAQINRYHMTYFAYMLEKLDSARDGDASLLDTSFVLRGSAFGDSNDHDFMDLPIVVAGGLVRHIGHARVEKGTTMSNLLLTGLQAVGMPVEKFGDSTGALKELALA
ncbi:DUF1552 domain-containing protein [Novosphingobium sediminicola]|uniref:DUF1552 domain-containing protein n=1 Tax=Novosphingobium sediminicola TaxID=563162 RepID=A0A7W6G8L5_9SPHN|nr:DUF1552 domain-containing protein [Novosphingobium sediminicola]MBB3956127.1 hypothetical protein [Novosphingobium sediminicola]